MDGRTELERITALEKQAEFNKDAIKGMTVQCRETHQKIDLRLEQVSKQLDDLQDSVNGGLDRSVEKAIAKHIPKEIYVRQGWTFSDTVKVAIISSGSAIVVALIANWGAIVHALGEV